MTAELIHLPEQAAARLLRGELVAIPTETVYGLAALASHGSAVARIFSAKERPSFDPLIAHVKDAKMAKELVVWNRSAQKLADHFWPGPLTLVLPRKEECTVSSLACSGLDSLGVRAPAHPLARQLLDELKEAFVAPSANLFGRISPTTAEHVASQLKDRIDAILDGGPCLVGVESTIISLIDEERPVLLRLGGLNVDEIECCLEKRLIEQTHSSTRSPQAPGLLPSHYAPKQKLSLKDIETPWPSDESLGYLAFTDLPDVAIALEAVGQAYRLSPTASFEEAASHLFDYLRRLEASELEEREILII